MTGCLDEVSELSEDTNIGGTETFSTPNEPISGITSPNPNNQERYERTYQQEVNGHRTGFTLTIPEALYNYYDERLRLDPTDAKSGNENAYGVYVADQFQRQYVRRVAEYFVSYGQENDLSRRQILNQVIGFVQQLEYTADSVNNGYDSYPQYPLETLVLRRGDCEDTSILTVALLKELGQGAILLGMPEDGHMAVGVKGENLPGTYYEYGGDRYYFLEATAPGNEVGEVPPLVNDGHAIFQEINSIPVIVFRWIAVPQSDGSVEVQAEMKNVGDGRTSDARMVAQLETGAEGSVDSGSSRRKSIRPSETETANVTVHGGEDAQRIKVQVRIEVGGHRHDKDESGWHEV